MTENIANKTSAEETEVKSDVPVWKDCGINIVLSEKFWNIFIRQFFIQLIEIINKDVITEAQTLKIDIKDLVTIYFTIENFNITGISFDDKLTRVELLQGINQVGIHIHDSSLHLNLTYGAYLDPNILSDNGTMLFGYSNLTFDLDFEMRPLPSDHKRIQIKVIENIIDIDPSKIYANLTNINAFGYQMLNGVKVFKSPIVQTITKAFEEYFEIVVNKAIQLIPIPFVFGDVVLDSSLIHSPIIIDEYLPIMLVGQFNPKGQPLPFKNEAIMPMYADNSNSLQMFVSDFTLRSFTYTMQRLGYLDKTCNNSLTL